MKPLIHNFDIKMKNANDDYKWYETLFRRYREDIQFTDKDIEIISKINNKDFQKIRKNNLICGECITPYFKLNDCVGCEYNNDEPVEADEDIEITSNLRLFKREWIVHTIEKECTLSVKAQEEFNNYLRAVPIVSKTHSSYFI